MHLFYGGHSSGLCTLHQYYSSSLPIRDYLLYFTTGGKPSTWFPPGGLVEQNFRARNFEKNRILNLRFHFVCSSLCVSSYKNNHLF